IGDASRVWRARRDQDGRLIMQDHVQPAPPCVLVIFGAAGDLTKRLLVPALYNLRRSKLLPDEFAIIGIARSDKHDEDFRQDFDESMRMFSSGWEDGADWRWLRERMSYLKGNLEDAETYRALGKRLAGRGERGGPGNVLFYLATPPSVFA